MSLVIVGNLKVTRGTTAQRTAITPDAGALIFDTDLNKVFVGDGTTVGGLDVGAGGATFIGLSDVPAAYTGAAGKAVMVKATEDGLEFDTPAGGGDMLAATYDPAAIAQQVVGTTAVQTVTHKDLTDASNTFPTNLAKKDAANAFTAQQTVTPYRASITGAVSIDLAGTAKSNTLILTLTGNVTSFALTNPVDGAKYSIWFIQDATGGHTMPVLPSTMKFSGGTAPTWTTTAAAKDLLCLDYGATEAIYMAAFSPNMS